MSDKELEKSENINMEEMNDKNTHAATNSDTATIGLSTTKSIITTNSLTLDRSLLQQILQEQQNNEAKRRPNEDVDSSELFLNYTQASAPSFKQAPYITRREQQKQARKQLWRPGKNIINAENALPYAPSVMIYSRYTSNPSSLPAKHYCDWTYQLAKYKDPRTRLRYANKDVFSFIRTLRPEQIKRLLELRKAQPMELS
jgi:INO80 complex subunit C